MALDKQRILNELGSVMTQLQSADCGCMGKLFSNQSGAQGGGSMSTSQPSGGCGGYGGFGGCQGGCCHNGGGCNFGFRGNAMGSGEPPGSSVMGNCNPKRAYADTYNYLNQNLMQPVVNEVYNDLKTITPENTVMNNAMASKMGLSQQGRNMLPGNPMQGGGNAMQEENSMQGANPVQGDMGIQQNIQSVNHGNVYMPENQMPGAVGYPMHATMENDTGVLNNLMQGKGIGNQMTMNNNQLVPQMTNHKMQQMMGGMGPNIVKMMQSDANAKPGATTPARGQTPGSMLIDAPQSPHGQIGVVPLNVAGEMNQGQYDADARMLNNINQPMFTPTTQYTTDPNATTGFYPNAQNYNITNDNMPQSHANLNSSQTGNSNPAAQQMASANRNYGQHTQGMKKFNEMFPGVIGGDLGFDPMAIAVQMNPKNHQKAAMDTMEKMLTGNKGHMNNAAPAANAAAANQSIIQQPNQQASFGQQVHYETNNSQQPSQQAQLQQQQQYQYQQQNIVEPDSVPTVNQGASGNIEAQTQQQKAYDTTPEQTYQPDLMIKDPIFPADTSASYFTSHLQRPQYHYNTLGQPIEVLPSRTHSLPVKSFPQTLSPQPGSGKLRNDIGRFNVKSTASKTSLIYNNPTGKAPSKHQLQNIYNQYKGSHSYTQQNIRNVVPQSDTYSEGKLRVQQANKNQRTVPLERVGGDSIANNQAMADQTLVKGQSIQQHIGDVPVSNKPHGDIIPSTETKIMKGNCRNGLQDIVYTPYKAFAWTFHGENDGRPVSPTRRYQNRG